jgi:hypothetical protein
MNLLIKITFGFILLVFFTGCSIYQHVSIDGDAPKNALSEFIIENDTASIIYSFHGQGGSLVIDIFNKLDKPLYVDWRKSALIIEDESFTLWKDEASLNGVSSSVGVVDNNGVAYSQGNIGGTLVKKDNMSFIPPHSKIVVNSYNLNTPFLELPKENGAKITFFTRNGEERSGRKYTFLADNSPYIFRIFLSIATDDSFNKPAQFDNSFWISDLITSRTAPQEFDIHFGNQFYNMKQTSGGNAVLCGALLGVIVLGAASGQAPSN